MLAHITLMNSLVFFRPMSSNLMVNYKSSCMKLC